MFAVCLWLLLGACAGEGGEKSIPSVDLAALEPALARRIELAVAELRGDPDGAESWKRLGLLYESNDYLGLAAECYREAIERRSAPELWYRLGIALSSAGLREQAAEAMARCVELEDGYAPAHWRLGSYRFDLNEFEAAEHSFRKALEADPKHLGGWSGLARVQLQRGEGEEAVETLESALKVKPGAPLVRKLLRSAYFEAGRLAEARALHVPWERIGSMGGDPWQREIRSLRRKTPMELALERLLTRDYQGVVDVMEPFVRENPRDPNAYAYLASGYNGLGRGGLARQTIATALEKDADSIVLLRVLAALHRGANELPQALEVLTRILEIDGLDLDAWRQKGDLEARAGRDADALESWQRIVRFDERDDELLLRIARTQLRLERWTDAQGTFERLIRLGAQRASACTGLAEALVALGRADEARRILERAPELDPGGEALRRRLAGETEPGRDG